MGQCDNPVCQKSNMAQADAFEVGVKAACSMAWCFAIANGTCADYIYNFTVIAGKGGYVYVCTNKLGGGVGEVTITNGALYIGERTCPLPATGNVYRIENPLGGFYFSAGNHNVTLHYCNNSGVNSVYHQESFCSAVGEHPLYGACPNRVLEMICTPTATAGGGSALPIFAKLLL